MNTPSGGSPESNSPDDGKDGGKKLEQQKSTDSGSPTQVGVVRFEKLETFAKKVVIVEVIGNICPG